MTVYIGGAPADAPAATIEGVVRLGGDIDFISGDSSVSIVGDDAADTIDLRVVGGPMVTDHGILSGLADDDHTQYSRADGSRAFTGAVGGILPAVDADLATKEYTDLRDVQHVHQHNNLSGIGTDDHHPQLHEADHVISGADPFLSTDLLDAAVRRIQTTTGPTILAVGAIAEEEVLMRSGSTLIGSPRIAANLFLEVRNETGSSIPIGKLVAATGYSVPEGRVLVSIADKDEPTKRPAVGITTEAIANNSNSDLLLSVGTLTGIDTSSFSINDQLVLGDDGNLSRPPPDVDPFTGEVQLIGSVTRVHATLGQVFVSLSSGLLPTTAAQFFATREITPTGIINGGEVTRAIGLSVDVTSGTGFVNDGAGAGDLFRVTWSGVPGLVLSGDDVSFVFVDENGLVQASTSMPSDESNIVIADVITSGNLVTLLHNHKVLLEEQPAQRHEYTKDVIGNVTVNGIATTINGATSGLDVDAGTFYSRDCRLTVPATAPIAFTYWYRDGSGGWVNVPSQVSIDSNNYDDGSGTLAALVGTEWKKDLLFVVATSIGAVEYHIFYGQEKFVSQAAAETGDLPAANSDVVRNGIRSGGIVIEGAAAGITSIVDVRPFIGQLSPGVTSVTDHGLLAGLADDDHAQYLPTTGARAMAGTLDMGTNPISNVGTVDGVDVSDHTGRHADGGADELPADTLAESASPGNNPAQVLQPDGAGGVNFSHVDHSDISGIGVDDHHAQLHNTEHVAGGTDPIDADSLSLDFSPSNYTPASGVLSGHFEGIDAALGVVEDHGALSGLGDDDHPQYLLADGTRAMAGGLDMGTNPITRVSQLTDVIGSIGTSGVEVIDNNQNVTAADLTAQQRFGTTESTLASITSDQNNVNPFETANLRLFTDATRSITGFSDGADGRHLYITNVGSFNLILTHEDDLSTAANRIRTSDGLDLTLTPDDRAHLIYDDASERWRVQVLGGEIQKYQFFADQLENPVTADWAVNALAPAVADSNNDGLTIRLFDDTTEEGVGFSLLIPDGATSMRLTPVGRAETAAGGEHAVGLQLYERGIPGSIDSWSAGFALDDQVIPTNSEDFQYNSQTIVLSGAGGLGIVTGQVHQFELTRVTTTSGIDLTGDWALLLIQAEII